MSADRQLEIEQRRKLLGLDAPQAAPVAPAAAPSGVSMASLMGAGAAAAPEASVAPAGDMSAGTTDTGGAGGIAGSAAKGASTGAAAGPWGAVIGAGIGLVSGLLKDGAAKKKNAGIIDQNRRKAGMESEDRAASARSASLKNIMGAL